MKIFILLFILSLGLSAKNTELQGNIVWPPPPDEARIEYKLSFTKAKELNIKKGFFSKIFNFAFGDEESTLKAPFGLHSDDSRVYVTDIASKSVYIFDTKENEELVLTGSDDESFLYPIDITTDNKGNIYVSDSVRAKIYVFEPDGDFLYTIKPRILQRSVGIAISNDDKKLYIVDPLSSQIHITTLKGKYLNTIGTKGDLDLEFNRPTFIDIGSDGDIYITDSMNHRVVILDKDENFIHSFGKLGQNIGDFGSPRGISLDDEDNIYVSDTMFNNIQIFNKKGELLLVLGRYGASKGEFALPEDISILRNGTIYISDTNNKRVQVLKKLDLSKQGGSK